MMPKDKQLLNILDISKMSKVLNFIILDCKIWWFHHWKNLICLFSNHWEANEYYIICKWILHYLRNEHVCSNMQFLLDCKICWFHHSKSLACLFSNFWAASEYYIISGTNMCALICNFLCATTEMGECWMPRAIDFNAWGQWSVTSFGRWQKGA